MGTHPIFESDFDCLTECPRLTRLASDYAPPPKIHINMICQSATSLRRKAQQRAKSHLRHPSKPFTSQLQRKTTSARSWRRTTKLSSRIKTLNWNQKCVYGPGSN